MPTINLANPAFISRDGAGRPNSGGSVEVFVADGLFTTYATIWADQVKTTELTNPVTLDDAGVIEIWYDVKVDIREKTNTGVLIRDTLNLDPNAGDSVVQGFNLAENGSFEVDSDSDGQPDSWTITPYTGSAIAITNDVVTNGIAALEFNTTAAGSGGGTATSAKFPVTEGSTVSVSFSFYATNATTLNTFVINWYDEDGVVSGAATTVTMPASGSVPTSWTNYQEEVTVSAGGTQGEIVLVGIASGGSNRESKAYFDGIRIFQSIKTLSTPTITTPTITGTPTINSHRAHGIRFLPIPQLIVNASAAGNAWTAVDMSTLGGEAAQSVTDGAVAVMVGGSAQVNHTTGIEVNMNIGLRLDSSYVNSNYMASGYAYDAAATGITCYGTGSGIVPLDSNGDFEWISLSSLPIGGTRVHSTSIYLLGYYV